MYYESVRDMHSVVFLFLLKNVLTHPVTALPAVAPMAHAAPRLFEKTVRNMVVQADNRL